MVDMPSDDASKEDQPSAARAAASKEPTGRNKPGVNTQIEILYPVDPLPISHVHFVKCSQMGGEILMDVGVFDDQALIAKLSGTESEESKDKPIRAFVSVRFGMSPNALGQVRANIEELWQKMKASGALKKLGLEEFDAS